MTNRHTSTSGNRWGWIEGADGNVCWSNDEGSQFTEAEAGKVAREHNEWLEQQRPLDVRIMEATVKHNQVVARLNKHWDAEANLLRELDTARVALEALRSQQVEAKGA